MGTFDGIRTHIRQVSTNYESEALKLEPLCHAKIQTEYMWLNDVDY